MKSSSLPPHDEMVRAMLASHPSYEGIFYTAVKTTGIFCRPTCSARKPKPENVVFYKTADDALSAGAQPCLPSQPRHRRGPAPDEIRVPLDNGGLRPNR